MQVFQMRHSVGSHEVMNISPSILELQCKYLNPVILHDCCTLARTALVKKDNVQKSNHFLLSALCKSANFPCFCTFLFNSATHAQCTFISCFLPADPIKEITNAIIAHLILTPPLSINRPLNKLMINKC